MKRDIEPGKVIPETDETDAKALSQRQLRRRRIYYQYVPGILTEALYVLALMIVAFIISLVAAGWFG
jgi:hypothetical protein